MVSSNVTCAVSGEAARVFGGTEDVKVSLSNTDTYIKLGADTSCLTRAPKERIKVYNGRFRIEEEGKSGN